MKTYDQLSFNHQAQIQMAVRGGIRGTINEWPTLRAALAELGHDFPDGTSIKHISEECKRYSFEVYRGNRTYETIINTLNEPYGFARNEHGPAGPRAVTYMTDPSAIDFTEEKTLF